MVLTTRSPYVVRSRHIQNRLYVVGAMPFVTAGFSYGMPLSGNSTYKALIRPLCLSDILRVPAKHCRHCMRWDRSFRVGHRRPLRLASTPFQNTRAEAPFERLSHAAARLCLASQSGPSSSCDLYSAALRRHTDPYRQRQIRELSSAGNGKAGERPLFLPHLRESRTGKHPRKRWTSRDKMSRSSHFISFDIFIACTIAICAVDA